MQNIISHLLICHLQISLGIHELLNAVKILTPTRNGKHNRGIASVFFLQGTDSIKILYFGAQIIYVVLRRFFQNMLQNFIRAMECSCSNNIGNNLVLSLAREPDKASV